MGRKSLKDEAVQMNVINLSWRTIWLALNNPTIDIDQKRMICLEIVKKTCPKEINLKSEFEIIYKIEPIDIDERLKIFQRAN